MPALFAYFDPGSGSLLVQAVVGWIAGLLIGRYSHAPPDLARQGEPAECRIPTIRSKLKAPATAIGQELQEKLKDCANNLPVPSSVN